MCAKIVVVTFVLLQSIVLHAQDPKLEYIGDITIHLSGKQTMIESDQLAWDVPGGTFELKSGGRGTLENPCGDWADIQDSGTFAMNLRCNIVMDDGSVIYFEYRGKFRFDEFGPDYAEKGKLITPFDGTKYWMALLLMKTTGTNYLWVNETIFVSKGVEVLFPAEGIKPYAKYKLYKVNY